MLGLSPISDRSIAGNLTTGNQLFPTIFVNSSVFYSPTITTGIINLTASLFINNNTFYIPVVAISSLGGSATSSCIITGALTIGSTGNTDAQQKFPPPPHYSQEGVNDPAWRDWFYRLNVRVQKEGQISWGQLSFLGSNLTDIQLRRHNDLQQIQGGVAGEEYHLTKSTYSDLNEVVTKTANYSVTLDDGTILCDASGGSLTITILPAIPFLKGKTLNIKKIDTTMNAVYITCSSQIDNVTTWTIVDSQTNMQLKCDGTTWRII